jgi:hypothetical protein
MCGNIHPSIAFGRLLQNFHLPWLRRPAAWQAAIREIKWNEKVDF